MQLSNNVTLELVDSGSDIERPSSEIHFKGEATAVIIGGAVLEACVENDGRFLLLVVDDIPYEEALYIYLLDRNFETLDTASLGGSYSSGSFSDLKLLQPSTIKFRFIGDCDWTICLLGQPRWRVPFLGDPKGVTHRPMLRRYFSIKGNPLPESRA